MAKDQHGALFDVEAYRNQVDEAVEHLRGLTPVQPSAGIVLGTGLGALADRIDVQESVPYDEIPHFPETTVASHEGHLLIGELGRAPVAALQGRFHLYEGYTPRQVTFPIRVLGMLGVDTLFLSNSAGGMNPHYDRGDLMLVTDHINLQGKNPLVGPNVEEWGPRFPDMSEPYDVELRGLAEEKALEHGIKLHEGVYLAVVGPQLETKAEYRYMRQIGGDVVGMSTVPEVLVARHMGIRCMAISVITDECLPDALEPIDIEEVMAAAGEAEPKLTRIMRSVIEEVGRTAPAGEE